MRLGVGGNPKGGAPPLLGGQAPSLAAAPLGDWISRAGAPLGTLYIEGGGRAAAPMPLAPPSPLATPLPLAEAWRSPAEIPAASTTTPSCCWISINLSFPLLDQEGGDVFPTVHVLNAEVPSVRHLVIGDLDHGEYNSIIAVLLNASARDLQGYVDALPSPSLLDDSID